MNYVYRYKDLSDDIVKYIGIVCRNGENSLEKRVYEHSKYDSWTWGKDWKIDYIKVKTKNDAHALEGHFIAKFETYKWFNKAKKDFGLLSFIDENFEWETYFDNISFKEPKTNRGRNDYKNLNTLEIIYGCSERVFELRNSLKILNELICNKDYKYSLEIMIRDKKSMEDELNLLEQNLVKIQNNIFKNIGLVYE